MTTQWNEREGVFLEEDVMEERIQKIMNFIRDDVYTPMRSSDMAVLLQVPVTEQEQFENIIQDLIKAGKLVLTKKGKLMEPEALNMGSGTFVGNAKGFGFVVTEDKAESDIFIPAGLTNGAMHKDKVLFKKTAQQRGNRPEGEIVSIIERGLNGIVGTLELEKGFGFVVPDNKKIGKDIFISRENCKGAVNGHKVVVKITKPPTESRNPEGKIIEILGHVNDPGVDILSIIREYELPIDFPHDVYAEVEQIEDVVTAEDIKGRTDLRDVTMVTIDGDDAKDLDDAVSLTKLENGHFKLGVHIADVSHYVAPHSALDTEAYKRGTSTYLVDRVIPMLPHKLSNDVCSLNPSIDRLTLSCIMEIDAQGTVVAHEICESVINIDRRMSYDVVNDLLINEQSEYKKEYGALLDMFSHMQELCKILRDKRIKRGAIEFDFVEAKIILDAEGNPIDIKAYERNIANSIIEEFMLVSNETVAEQFFWLDIPFLYRSHEEPDSEKMIKLGEFIHNFGYSFKGSATHPKSIQKLLANFESTPQEIIIDRIVLRSLKQARYTDTNDGHFGLAAKYYCHFTSPIRRYPDLQIHRIIKAYLHNGITDKKSKSLAKHLPEVAAHCSRRERVSEEAERETDSLKKVQYMKDKVSNTFDGIISSVTRWGLYVELPNTVEGMVSVSAMDDDYYIFDEKNMLYVGERTKKMYRLGDKVKVLLTRANVLERTLDFEFVE